MASDDPTSLSDGDSGFERPVWDPELESFKSIARELLSAVIIARGKLGLGPPNTQVLIGPLLCCPEWTGPTLLSTCCLFKFEVCFSFPVSIRAGGGVCSFQAYGSGVWREP